MKYGSFPPMFSMDELDGLYEDAYDSIEELFDAFIDIRDQIYDSLEELNDDLSRLDEIMFYIHNAKIKPPVRDIPKEYGPDQEEELPFV